MNQQPFRLQPKAGPEHYKTFGLSQPARTHFRTATCQEVDCANYARGWRIVLDVSTDLDRRRARYIRDHAGRAYSVIGQEGDVITLEFSAGQKCFEEHRVPLHRMPNFYVVDGDWRGNPRGTPVQKRSIEAWRDDLGEHTLMLKERIERG
jgi:hypothetical protein